MSYQPAYTITSRLLGEVEQVAALHERIQAAAVQVPWIPALQKDARIRNAHSSTAIEGNPLTLEQVRCVADALAPSTPAVVSVFAGRIADTGRNPEPLMREARALLESKPKAELLWASVREVLNIAQADACGCHIVTVPHDILGKALKMWSLDLDELSLDTVKMFAADAEKAGFTL